MTDEPIKSSGVQQLIDRLRAEGVAKGNEEADAVVADARRQAMDILDSARQEADEVVSSAKEEAQRTRASGEEAIRLAGRDAILHLTEELRSDFERKLRRLIGQCLEDVEFLKSLIQAIARRAIPAEEDGPVNIVLLADRFVTQDLSLGDDALTEFVTSLGGDAVRDGLTFRVANSDAPAVRVQIVNDNLEIDLSTETLTNLLLSHLSPRFREIMERS